MRYIDFIPATLKASQHVAFFAVAMTFQHGLPILMYNKA
jgi:hypothetical protein